AVLRERVKVPLPLAEHGRRRHHDDLTLALRREHDGRGDRERDERFAHADLVREDLTGPRLEPAQQLLRGAALALGVRARDPALDVQVDRRMKRYRRGHHAALRRVAAASACRTYRASDGVAWLSCASALGPSGAA